jgi:large subunit ribosomal protein L33
MRERMKIVLACSVCEARNYKTTKKRDLSERLILKKFCPACRKHTEHRETR